MPRPSAVDARRRPRHAPVALLAPLALLGWGCATNPAADEPSGFVRDLAMLHRTGGSVLEAPDTVRAGMPFTVTGYGAGSGTIACNAPDGTVVTTEETVVRITAYMRYPSAAVMMPCTRDYRTYPFTATVQLARAGTATVRFVGARERVDGQAVADSMVKRIVVRP